MIIDVYIFVLTLFVLVFGAATYIKYNKEDEKTAYIIYILGSLLLIIMSIFAFIDGIEYKTGSTETMTNTTTVDIIYNYTSIGATNPLLLTTIQFIFLGLGIICFFYGLINLINYNKLNNSEKEYEY